MQEQLIGVPNLEELPSELLQPYINRYLMSQMEGLAMGLFTPDDVRKDLKGVQYFVQMFGGIHCRYACNNVYDSTIQMSDDVMKEIAVKTFS